MSTLAYDNLPDVQRSVKARPLFAMSPLQVVGGTPAGVRRIGARRRSCRAHSLSPNLGRTASPNIAGLNLRQAPLACA
jgi:hypothetical protein